MFLAGPSVYRCVADRRHSTIGLPPTSSFSISPVGPDQIGDFLRQRKAKQQSAQFYLQDGAENRLA